MQFKPYKFLTPIPKEMGGQAFVIKNGVFMALTYHRDNKYTQKGGETHLIDPALIEIIK